MMNSNINTENVNASIETPLLNANLSSSTLVGDMTSNTLTGVSNANTLVGAIGSAVIGGGIKSIYVNNYEQSVSNDTAYITLTYDMIYNLPTIPTKLSQLENDEGFINSGYASEDDFTALSNQVGLMSNTLSSLDDDVSAISSDIDTINDTLTNKVDSSDFNTLSDQVTTNTNNIGTNTNNIATNTNDISNLSTLLTATMATVTSNSALIEDNSDAIGTLSNLTTTDKTNLVSAINEVKGDIPTNVSQLTNDSGYVKSTDISSYSVAGVLKSGEVNSFGVNSSAYAYCDTHTYANYLNKTNANFISKGTLENVITGKQLVNSTDLATKQDTLVSGTNIKTINNQSLLGSGDITISGGQATDVQINGTSITSSNVADIQTNGTYNASSNKIATMSDIPSVPTATSQLTNDSGFITNTVNDLTNYTLTSNLATVATSGSYNDLSNTPTIPTKTSDLTNDSGYVTNTDYASASTGGVVKVPTYSGLSVSSAGNLAGTTKTYADYSSASNSLLISKGTLENVIVGKDLTDIFYTETVTLASNITINAHSNYGSASQSKTISPRSGYKPILVVPANSWNWTCNLWYCILTSDTNIQWRAGNVHSSSITVTISVIVLYVKSSLVTT